MTFSIITPSFGQLDWLRLCIASVADQAVSGAEIGDQRSEDGAQGAEGGGLQIDDCSLLIPDNSAGQRQGAEDGIESPANAGKVSEDERGGSATCNQPLAISNSQSSPLCVEHIIQDAGSPGIEEFARGMSELLIKKYGGKEVGDLDPFEILHLQADNGYALRIFKEPDAGMYDAINRGLTKIRGDYWAWLNSDEQYLEGTLSQVTTWFEVHSDADILCGDAVLLGESGEPLSYRRTISPMWHHTRLIHLSSLSCASFYKRYVVESGGGFDTSWRSIGDAEWMARLIKRGFRIHACKRLFASFTFTGQNTSESPIAGLEAESWRRMPDAPPRWLKLPVILHHRWRKLWGGAYGFRDLTYSLYEKHSFDRRLNSAKSIGWKWPEFPQKSTQDTLSEKKEFQDGTRRFNVIGSLLAASSSEIRISLSNSSLANPASQL